MSWYRACTASVHMLRAHRRLRIAQVSPLYESVPPKLYDGTERIVSYLTEELVDQGHDVTLFASGDSRSRARVIAPCARALRLADVHDPLPYHFAMLEAVYRRADDFDVIHFHCDYIHYASSRRLSVSHATTLHGRLDLPDLVPLYEEFADVPVVSVSMAQRAPLDANWIGTVYHGLPLDLHELGAGGDYLAFVGRVSPEKRLDRAIEIAERAGMPLKVAAKVDKPDREYHEQVIAPLLRGAKRVEFLGELDEHDKTALLRGARALVFPIDWPEPFGLVMIEAMACGTPVIAWRMGSVPEVIDDGVTGAIVDSIDAAVAAVDRVGALSREAVRAQFEHRFSATRMARDYVELYHHLDARDRSTQQPGLLHPGHQLAGG